MVLPWIPVVLVLVAIETVFVLGIALVLVGVQRVLPRRAAPDRDPAPGALLHLPDRLPDLGTCRSTRTWLGRSRSRCCGIYELNPLVRFIEAFRDVLYNLRFPPLWDLGYVTVWAAAMLALGLWVFSRLDRRLAEEV